MLGAAQGGEDVARTAMPQVVREAHAGQFRIVGIERQVAANDPATVDGRNESVQLPLCAAPCDERADRYLTTALESAEKCALRARGDRRVAVGERRDHGSRCLVIGADLNRDRTLTRGG